MSDTATATPAKTRKIRDILALHDLLTTLGDGLPEYEKDKDGNVILDADGRPQVKRTPFDLGLRARYAVLRSLTATGKVVKRVQTERDEAITAASGGTGKLDPKTDGDAEKIKLVQADMDKLLASDADVNLHLIPIEDLRLEINRHLSTSLVLALGDLVSEPAA